MSDNPIPHPTYRMSVLKALLKLTATSDKRSETSEALLSIVLTNPTEFPVMSQAQVSAALANCKAMGLVSSRINSNADGNPHAHLWWLTAPGLSAVMLNKMPSSKPKPLPVVDSTPASEIFTPSPLPRQRKQSQPQVTASVVFTFNGTKYTLPLEVIKAIKEFTL